MTKAQPASKTTDRTAIEELPAPRFAAWWAALVFAVCTLALSYPMFSGKFLGMPWSDQYIAGYPFRSFALEFMKAGKGIPQWNPYLYGGLPFVGAAHGDIFYPTVLLRLIFGTGEGMALGIALHLFIAGMLTYAFLRQWGLGFFPSVIGGVAYMLSGQLAGQASPGHDGKMFSSALFPLLLITITWIRDGRWWSYGAFSLAVGLAAYAHPQLLEYLLLASFAWGLFLMFSTAGNRAPLSNRERVQRLALTGVALVVGGAIGGAQFVPLAKYTPWSPRSGDRGWDWATSFSQPIEEFAINSWLPQFTGEILDYWGRNGIHLHSEYLGVVVIFLAIAAFGAEGFKSFRRFWLWVFIIGALWSMGSYTPFYRLVWLIPLTHKIRAPSTVYFIYAFALAVLAAFGARRLLALRLAPKYGYIMASIGAATALIMTVGGASMLAKPIASAIAAERYPSDPAGYEAQMIDPRIDANLSAVVNGAWRSFAFIGLAAALLWAVATTRIPRRIAAWGLVMIVAADLWSIERHFWQFSPPPSQVWASDPAIDLIKKSDQPARVVAIALGQYREVGRDPLFDGSGFMAHDVRDLTGYHGNELARYQSIFGASAERGYDPSRMLDPGVWAHENVRYLYTTVPDSVISQLQQELKLAAPFKKLVGPVKDAVGSTVYLYEVPGQNPFAWVAGGAVRAGDDQSMAAVLDQRFDPTRAAIVDTGSTIKTTELSKIMSASITPHVASYEAGKISIDLSGPAADGSVLVLSENFYPGWTATDGGKALPVSRANYNLIGVGLATGTRHVDLAFSDPFYAKGKVVSLAALTVSILALIAGLVADRRRSPTAAVA
jgi:hypothetical protein